MKTLKTIPDSFIDCCITSPPYYGLRDYNIEGQIGLEETPENYIEKLVCIFKEVKRILKNDGTLWVNIGDSYAGSGKGRNSDGRENAGKNSLSEKYAGHTSGTIKKNIIKGCKPKDLIGVPWMLAFALRADGWFLRQDIIWHKPDPMPESVTDRCTKAHEYIFLLSKSKNYFFNNEIIKIPVKDDWGTRNRENGKYHNEGSGLQPHRGLEKSYTMANRRDVWTIPTSRFNEAHFATFPPDLVIPCILAGSRESGIILDPFMGSGTTAIVAMKLLRKFIGCELNSEYIKIAEKRISEEKGLFDNVDEPIITPPPPL